MSLKKPFSVCFLLLLGNSLVFAQAWETTSTQKSNERARSIIYSSLEAHGGKERLEAVSNVSLNFKGTHNLPLQNIQPDFSRNPLPKEGKFIFDIKGRRMVFEEKIQRAGVYTGWHRLASDGNKTFDLNLNSNQYRPSATESLMQRTFNVLPFLTLLDAWKRPATLRWVGDVGFENKSHHVINYVNAAGQQIALFINAESKTLTKFERLASLSIYGDRTWEFTFSNYESTKGILLPMKRQTRLNGVVTESLTNSEISVNIDLAPALFMPPPDSVPRDDSAVRAAQKISVNEIATGVYTVDNPQGTDLKVLFVVFEDFVLVAGAPPGVSEIVIEKIKETLPGKRIRYIVPTHHHSDHAGGLRSYIAEGVTVVTTPGNKSFVEAMAAAPFTINPDKLSAGPRAAVIETLVSKRRIFADPTQRVELYDIGPTPHASEMIVVYLPKEKIVYQGDLLELDDDDPITDRTANEVTVHFYQKITELGLPVNKIIGTEGRHGTLEDLRKAVKLRKGQ